MSNDYYNYTNSPGPGPGSPSPGPGPGNGRTPSENDLWDTVSWVIDVGLIFSAGPLGLVLTIAHATGHDPVGRLLRSLFGGAPKKRASASTSARRRTSSAQQTRTAQQTKTPQRDQGRFPGAHRADSGAIPKTVFGWILVCFGLFMTIGSLFDGVSGVWRILSMLSIALGGGALVLSGMMGRRKEAKFRQCFTVTGDRGVVDIRGLAKTMGIKQEEAYKLITEMVERGYYGEKAYVDHGRMLLVIDVEQMRDVYRREDEAKKAAATQAETVETAGKMTEYERYVERIRQADVDIEDEAMSEKIRRMQSLTASIFAEVEAHPEKRPMIDRFMNYYLPTTLKLLESYAHIEAQGVSGENMAKAKADIEGIADTLVAGYEKQLDKLYRAEAMDIAGDVSVIENMLKRDGLSGQSDFGQQAMGGH